MNGVNIPNLAVAGDREISCEGFRLKRDELPATRVVLRKLSNGEVQVDLLNERGSVTKTFTLQNPGEGIEDIKQIYVRCLDYVQGLYFDKKGNESVVEIFEPRYLQLKAWYAYARGEEQDFVPFGAVPEWVRSMVSEFE